MTRRLSPRTLGLVSPEGAETTPSLEHARLRQQAIMRRLRLLGLGLLALIEVTGVLSSPRPGLSGDRLGILFGLAGVAIGLIGGQLVPRDTTAAQAACFGVLMASSVALVWLQPNGPGFLIVFLAVVAAALRGPASLGVPVVVSALVGQAVVGVLAGGRSVYSVVLDELGALAFYAVALLARRLREGQDRAEQLLLELEESRHAQAQAAALGERQRLAREMHDVLAHSLSGLVLQLEMARLLAVRDLASTDLAEVVERSHHLAKAGLEEARRAIGLLRDDELPGPERLPTLVSSFERDTGCNCTLDVTGAECSLSSEARLTMYRVAQEALTNVRKHANPERVELHLSYEPAGTRLTIEDFGGNGHGQPSPEKEGYGLTGMRERAELLGGGLTATSTATGFRVELWVPA